VSARGNRTIDLVARPFAGADPIVASIVTCPGSCGASTTAADSPDTGQQKAVTAAPRTPEDITEVYSAALVADQLSVRTVDTKYAIGGTTSIYTISPLERAHRDIHMMARHVIAQPTWLEDAGRVRFGLTPTNQLYSV
jgi:hypothetical protein